MPQPSMSAANGVAALEEIMAETIAQALISETGLWIIIAVSVIALVVRRSPERRILVEALANTQEKEH